MTLWAIAGMTTSPQFRESPETANCHGFSVCWAQPDSIRRKKTRPSEIVRSIEPPVIWFLFRYEETSSLFAHFKLLQAFECVVERIGTIVCWAILRGEVANWLTRLCFKWEANPP